MSGVDQIHNQKDLPSVLFINRVYPPDDMATGQLLAQLAEALAREGWRVTVLTSRSCPDAPRRERMNGVEVVRVAGMAFSRSSHWRRALAYLSLYPLFLTKSLFLPRHGTVVTMTDPPLQLITALPLKWLKGSRTVHWAQDVYPELAVELGVLRERGWPARLLHAVSSHAMRRYDKVIAVGECMAGRLAAKGLSRESVQVIPNWAPFPPPGANQGEARSFRRDQGWADSDFVVMYSGNFGLAHPFEAILEAAAQLAESTSPFRMVMAGDGPRLAWVKEQAAARNLANVTFLPRQPLERLPVMLAAADAHLATMEANLAGLVVPSKVYGILGAGRPCLFLGPPQSEAALLIRRLGAGEVIETDHGGELFRVLSRWRNDGTEYARILHQAKAAANQVVLEKALPAFRAILQ